MPRSRAAPLTRHRGVGQRVGAVNHADLTHLAGSCPALSDSTCSSTLSAVYPLAHILQMLCMSLSKLRLAALHRAFSSICYHVTNLHATNVMQLILTFQEQLAIFYIVNVNVNVHII